jgi:glycosyltransferase involved in cell wall biosynthesis
MKIAVYAICKNEEQFVKTFCESAKDADVILIADTGSTDNTVPLAKECGAQVYNISVIPWRFDKARETALNLLPADIDVCISLDLDEQLEPGWRKELERTWQPNTTRMRYRFDWGHGIIFYADKIHSRKGYYWHHAVHEIIRPDPRTEEVWAKTDMLMVTHHADETKSRGQYLPLLEMSVKEDPYCPRNAFYYARELTFYGKNEEAIVALKKYLEMPEATWNNERAYAMRLLGRAYDTLGQNGIAWYRKGCAEDSSVRETWCALAEACNNRGLHEEAFGAASNALKIKDVVYNYTMEDRAWKDWPHDQLAIAAYYMSNKELALKHGELALSFKPTDERLLRNLEFYKE